MNIKSVIVQTIIILNIIALSASALAREVVVTYNIDEPSLITKGDYQVIYFENSKLLGKTGQAAVPFIPVRVLLPPGEIAVGIEFTAEGGATIDQDIRLFPMQDFRPLSDTSTRIFNIDQPFYSSSEGYPADPVAGLNTQFMNGYSVALAVFCPIKYVPSLKQVTWYRKITLRILTAPDPDADQRFLNLNSSDQVIRRVISSVKNPDLMKEYPKRQQRTLGYDYLIITPSAFVTEFDTLKWLYRKRGFRTEVASKETILANTSGVDAQEKIRNYIINEYQNEGISTVLLAGDVDKMPYRGFFCEVLSGGVYVTETNMPSDLYFAGLDHTWNEDGDSYWGEKEGDSTDLLPEIAIGRMPFSDTVELHNLLHKTLDYMEDPVLGEFTKPLLVAEYLYGDPITWGEDYLNLLIGSHSDNGYTTVGIPVNHDIDSLYERQADWTKSDLLTKINSGKITLHHCGHANYTYLMKMYNNDITNINFSQVNGSTHNYMLVYTHGCNCGGYDYSDCIAERMVNIDNFAVTFIGNSRYGWFNEGTTDGPAIHIHREFTDAVYHDSIYWTGAALTQARIMVAPWVDLSNEWELGATRWNFYDIHVLGDPLLAVWTHEQGDVSVNYPSFIPIGEDTVEISLSKNGQPLKNFQCALMVGDSLYGGGLTDDDGNLEMALEQGIPEGTANLIISGYNKKPFVKNVIVADYWRGYTDDWNDTHNWFTEQIPDSNTYVIIPVNPEGGYYPGTNMGATMVCKGISIEEGAVFNIPEGSVMTISGN